MQESRQGTANEWAGRPILGWGRNTLEGCVKQKKLVVGALAALMTVGGMGFAQAKAGDEGSNGNRGLCNAYAHNNDHAKNNGQSFARLAATAGDYNGDNTTDAQDVLDYCANEVPVVGNPNR